MKILIVADTYHPDVNGCAYFTQRLAYYKEAHGHEVAVVAPSRSLKHTYEKKDNIHIFGISSLPTFVNGVRFAHPFLLKTRMKKILGEFKPDVIHMQSHFTINRAMFKVAKREKFPVVATNHFMPDNLTHYLPLPERVIKWVNEYMWRDFAKVFNQIEFVASPTETAANLIRSRLTVPVESVTNGIDLEKFNPNNDGEYLRKLYSIPKAKPVLLYVGRLDAEKRVHQLIETSVKAMKEVDFSLVIAGKGFEAANLKKLAKKLGISHSVIFTGFVADEDLPNLYAIADCFTIACPFELQCLAVMEAMATGLPIIAVNAGALPHLVEDGVNGTLFEAGDATKLSQDIIFLLSNKKKRENMGRESLRLISAHGIETMIEKYGVIYEQAVLSKNKIP